MGFVNLGQPDVGVESLERWLRWNKQTASIVDSNQTLNYVMEMAKFQRLVGDHEFAQATTALGESVVFSFIVPRDRAYKVINITGEHNDAGSLIWTGAILRAAGPIVRLWRLNIVDNNPFSFYPGQKPRPSTTSDAQFDVSAQKLELFANDTLSITVAAFAGAGSADLTMRMERIPVLRRYGLPFNTSTDVIP